MTVRKMRWGNVEILKASFASRYNLFAVTLSHVAYNTMHPTIFKLPEAVIPLTLEICPPYAITEFLKACNILVISLFRARGDRAPFF